MTAWTCALTLDSTRQTIAGSETALVDAIRRGADLRVYTEFRHNEHIDVGSTNSELVREVAEFAVTYLVDDRWAAGLMSLRLKAWSSRLSGRGAGAGSRKVPGRFQEGSRAR